VSTQDEMIGWVVELPNRGTMLSASLETFCIL